MGALIGSHRKDRRGTCTQEAMGGYEGSCGKMVPIRRSRVKLGRWGNQQAPPPSGGNAVVLAIKLHGLGRRREETFKRRTRGGAYVFQQKRLLPSAKAFSLVMQGVELNGGKR